MPPTVPPLQMTCHPKDDKMCKCSRRLECPLHQPITIGQPTGGSKAGAGSSPTRSNTQKTRVSCSRSLDFLGGSQECLGKGPGYSSRDFNRKISSTVLSDPLRSRVQSRSRTQLRIAASIAFLFRVRFTRALDAIAHNRVVELPR